MKKIFSVFLMALAIAMLLSCQTTKESASLAAKSETVASSADRLCSSLMTDSIDRWFMLSADSMIILYDNMFLLQEDNKTVPAAGKGSKVPRDEARASVPDDLYFLSAKPPEKSSSKKVLTYGTKAATAQQLKGLRIYGLHIDAGDKEKSNVQTSAKDSETAGSQSSVAEGKEMRKATPVKAPMLLFYALIIACSFYGIYRFIRWIRNR